MSIPHGLFSFSFHADWQVVFEIPILHDLCCAGGGLDVETTNLFISIHAVG